MGPDDGAARSRSWHCLLSLEPVPCLTRRKLSIISWQLSHQFFHKGEELACKHMGDKAYDSCFIPSIFILSNFMRQSFGEQTGIWIDIITRR